MSLRCLALVAGWLFCLPAHAAVLELLPPAEGDYRPTDPLTFDVSQLPDEVAPRLALEIDDVNVTEFIRREGNNAVLDLPTPIEPGLRRVRVVDYRPDGTIEEIGNWTIEVAAASVIQQAELSADLAVGFDYRAADHNLQLETPFSNVPGRTLLHGSLNAQGRVAGDGWSVDGYAPVLFRDDFQTQSGQPWDLGDFHLRAERGRFQTLIGHQSPVSSLVMEGFHRRGASVTVGVPEVRTDVQAFALRADPISGFEESLGVQDSDERVVGVTTQSTLFSTEQHQTTVQTTYLRGRRQGFGAVEAGFGSPESGTAWSVLADGSFYEQRIFLRGEYARTRFQENTFLAGNPERDDAFAILVGVRPLGTYYDWNGRSVQWEIAFELDEIGQFFDSPASLFPDNDRRRQRAYSQLQIDGFSFYADWVRTRYNPDGRTGEPIFSDESLHLTTRWAPFWSEDDAVARWLANPYIELEYARQSLKPTRTPDPTQLLLNDLLGGIFLPVYSDQLQRLAGIRVGGSNARLSWTLGYLLQQTIDRTRLEPNTRSDGISGSMNFHLGSSASLGMTFQRERFKDERFRTQTVSWSGTLYGYWQPNERIIAAFDASLFRTRDTNSTVDTRLIVVSPSLKWHAVLAKPNRPGLSFTIDGTWKHTADDVNLFATDDVFQVFLKAEMNLPIRFGRGV